MLVCLGCCLFTEVSRAFDSPSPDRVAAQILTGVGFLGAGTILRTGLEIKGLTTAASIWTVAAIGMSISLGGAFLWVAIVATLLTLATLRLVAALEDRIVSQSQEHQLLVTVESRSNVPALIGALESIGAGIERLELERIESGTLLKIAVKSDKGAIEAVAALPGVTSVTWAGAL